MILFKLIYKVSMAYGHLKATYRITNEIVELLGLNATYILDVVAGPDL